MRERSLRSKGKDNARRRTRMAETKPLIPIKREGLDEIAEALLKPVPGDAGSPTRLPGGSIDKSAYVRIPASNVCIAKNVTNKGLSWEGTHFALADQGLFMPTLVHFTDYFLGVKNAIFFDNALQDGNGRLLNRNEIRDLWQGLASSPITFYDAWLDAKFVAGSGHGGLDLQHSHRVIGQGTARRLEGKTEPLSPYQESNGMMDLIFSHQGVPLNKSIRSFYSTGENIYFWQPGSGFLASFRRAGDGCAVLDCHERPDTIVPTRGVLACCYRVE
jgi:hypothetical protein